MAYIKGKEKYNDLLLKRAERALDRNNITIIPFNGCMTQSKMKFRSHMLDWILNILETIPISLCSKISVCMGKKPKINDEQKKLLPEITANSF